MSNYITVKPGFHIRRDLIRSISKTAKPYLDKRGWVLTYIVVLEPDTLSKDAKYNRVWVTAVQAEHLFKELGIQDGQHDQAKLP